MSEARREVTVIYCCDDDLSLYRKTKFFNLNGYGEMIIPDNFRFGKTIVAVCDGNINVINSIGDRLVSDY